MKEKSSAYGKYEYRDLGRWYIKSTFFKEVLKLKQNFQKNNVVTDKTLFFVKSRFCTHHSIYLNISFRNGNSVWK